MRAQEGGGRYRVSGCVIAKRSWTAAEARSDVDEGVCTTRCARGRRSTAAGTHRPEKCERDQRRSPPSSRRGRRLRVEESPRSPRGSPSSSRVFARRARRRPPRARGGFGIKTLGWCYTRETPRCDVLRASGPTSWPFRTFASAVFPGAAPSATRASACLVAPRAMAVRAVALFDRAGAVDGAARRAATLDRRSDGRLAPSCRRPLSGDGFERTAALRGRGGRARPAAGRGVDGVDDRSGNRREVREYPFGRVSRTSNPVVPSETAPSVISHAERADRGDGSWTQQNASRARWEQTGPVAVVRVLLLAGVPGTGAHE